jgi:hypothetical protein
VRYAVMASVNTASTVLASGQANVSGDTLVNTGVSGLAGKVIMVSTYTEDNNVPLTLAHVVGTSGTSFRVKFTNTSDGTANAGTFKINWVVVG